MDVNGVKTMVFMSVKRNQINHSNHRTIWQVYHIAGGERGVTPLQSGRSCLSQAFFMRIFQVGDIIVTHGRYTQREISPPQQGLL